MTPSAIATLSFSLRERIDKSQHIALLQLRAEHGDHRFETFFIFSVKTLIGRAINIQHANQLTVHRKRQYDLGIAGGIAGDMAGERVHITDTLNPIFHDCAPTNPLTRRNANTGNSPLEGPKEQRVTLQKIKARPIDALKAFKQECTAIGQNSDEAAFTRNQCG